MKKSDFTGLSIVSVATRVACHLAEAGIECVVVGGLAVEIYTGNRYQTLDIDMVNVSMNTQKALDAAMNAIGFVRKGRYYHNTTTQFFVEFPSPPLGVADDITVKPVTIATGSGTLQVLSPVDMIRDRLAWACNGTVDRQAITQSICLMLNQNRTPSEFSTFIRKQSESASAYHLITTLCNNTYAKAKEVGVTEMDDIEGIVENEFINLL